MSSESVSASVGKEILSYCTKCKLDLGHMIVAMKGDRVVKVQCKTCQGFHAFRTPKGATEAKPKTKRAPRATSQKVSVESEWERLMAEHPERALKTYTPQTSFKTGDKVNHPTFGQGVVGKLIHPNKVEIVFQTDIRILIHTAAPSTLNQYT